MSNVKAWSGSAASNNSASPNGAPEGMAPSGINDTIREVMAAVRRLYSDTNGSLTSTGSSNAYVLTTNQTVTAYADGDYFMFEANHTNTGASTVNIDTLGGRNILNPDGSALSAGQLTSGGRYLISYDGTQFILIGGLDSALKAIAALAKTDSNFIVGNGTTWVAETGTTARASMGVAIGSDVQAYAATLAAIAALGIADGNFIVGNGSTWVAETGATARASLGLGSIATYPLTISTSAPSGGSDGDLWFVREA